MHAQTMTSNMCLVETIEHCVVSVGLSSLCDDRLWGVRCDSRYTTFHTATKLPQKSGTGHQSHHPARRPRPLLRAPARLAISARTELPPRSPAVWEVRASSIYAPCTLSTM